MLLNDFIVAFRVGKELTNATTWKNRTLAVNHFILFFSAILAIAAAFGYPLNIDSTTLESLAGGVVAAVTVFNSVMHMVTSTRVGLPAKPGADDPRNPADFYRGG